MNIAVIFGGTGFIGSYFAEDLLKRNEVEKVILADLKVIDVERFGSFLNPLIFSRKIKFKECDVRKKISEQLDVEPTDDIVLIANFAAVHREPGHEADEYYETNILGAENVCEWAELVECQDLVFTSSIAPYGAADEVRTEESIPVPFTPYGGSKLVAEKIHIGWQKALSDRQLTIVRPGVVFGAGEGGNVSRLVKAVLKGYFFYTGNQNTRKAGVYVKELTNAMLWVHHRNKELGNKLALFNMSMETAPSVSEYVETIKKISNKEKRVYSLPYSLLYVASYFVQGVATLFRIEQPINPVRIKKLVKSNFIDPAYLKNNGYEFQYNLTTAMEDWKLRMPTEW